MPRVFENKLDLIETRSAYDKTGLVCKDRLGISWGHKKPDEHLSVKRAASPLVALLIGRGRSREAFFNCHVISDALLLSLQFIEGFNNAFDGRAEPKPIPEKMGYPVWSPDEYADYCSGFNVGREFRAELKPQDNEWTSSWE